jgi:hypothetical protein
LQLARALGTLFCRSSRPTCRPTHPAAYSRFQYLLLPLWSSYCSFRAPGTLFYPSGRPTCRPTCRPAYPAAYSRFRYLLLPLCSSYSSRRASCSLFAPLVPSPAVPLVVQRVLQLARAFGTFFYRSGRSTRRAALPAALSRLWCLLRPLWSSYSSCNAFCSSLAPLVPSPAALVVLLVVQCALQLAHAFGTFLRRDGRPTRPATRPVAYSRLWYSLLPLWSSYSSCSPSCSPLAPLVPSPAALDILLVVQRVLQLARALGALFGRSGRPTRRATRPPALSCPWYLSSRASCPACRATRPPALSRLWYLLLLLWSFYSSRSASWSSLAPLVPSTVLVVLLFVRRILLLSRASGTSPCRSGRPACRVACPPADCAR